MAPLRIAVDGDGPLAVQLLRQLIDAHLRGDASEAPVAVRLAEGRAGATRLSEAIAADEVRVGPRTRVVDGGLAIADLRVQVLSAADPWPAHDRVVDAHEGDLLAAHVSVVARLADLVAAGVGLRWLMLSIAGSALPSGLDAAIHHARPDGVGKTSVRVLDDGAARTMVRMSCVTGRAMSVDGLLDLLREWTDARSPGDDVSLAAARPAPLQVLGRARVVVDGSSCRAIGPMIELEAHYDVLALAASRLLARAIG